jgi:hypothetical protein
LALLFFLCVRACVRARVCVCVCVLLSLPPYFLPFLFSKLYRIFLRNDISRFGAYESRISVNWCYIQRLCSCSLWHSNNVSYVLVK